MEQIALLALTASTLAQIGLTAHILLLRSFKMQAYFPLAIFLISMGIMTSWPLTSVFVPQLLPAVVALSFPALLLLGPSLWFYVEGITSETPWRIHKMHYWHFVPLSIGMVIAFITFCFPYEMRETLLVKGDLSEVDVASPMQRQIAMALLVIAFVLILAWIVQSAYYFVRIIRHLTRYRRRLKDLFASTEFREMQWLTWLLLAVGVMWVVSVITILSDNLFHRTIINGLVSNGLLFAMIWSLSVWGLRQKPGFEVLYRDTTLPGSVKSDEEKADQKYERSALNEEQSSRIAQKIEGAMTKDELYLDSSLSLRKLSGHISVSPNYISQTLNETVGVNFFDYVNRYRVEAAKKLLIEGEDTVLDIAMMVGFNAKSSFYSAFKKETQQTPSGFRKENSGSKC
ncbi:MAG: hypothetical protein B0W54_12790 [Cellvibrio sp. 79]|nr:MAG: hypothetical protein B0W54_12790 [Cellvibrio sp. 79]